jgi:signal transduction histidine kinase
MGYFRNPEIKKEGIIWLFAVLLTAFLGWYLASVRGLYLCLFCAVIFAVIHFSSSVIRYRKIAGLADEVQHFLHVFEYVDVGGEKEGELAILRTEIRKMMNKLNHQANLLMEDKKYLLNSIADISHQIRTPLTAINLIVSRLRGEKNEADRQRLLHELEQLLVHMDWLIEALLKMAKLDAGTVSMKKKTVNVSDLLKKSVQDFLIPMELREQNLVIDCTDMVSLRGDEYWLREAVGNIVKNCMEHTPDGGVINTHVEENAVYTAITISDTGGGIAEEDLPNIFKRFYKGRNSTSQSFGIGLALARMIVTGHGGTVRAYNNRDGGASFEIKFYKSTI